MENFPKETATTAEYRRSVSQRMKENEVERDYLEKKKYSEDNTKGWRIPFSWNWKFRQAKRKDADTALVLFFNKKNEIEAPKFMPIYSGNMIIHRNKAYIFDPRAVWRMKVKGYPIVYCIKETDRRPIRNENNELMYYQGKLVYKSAAISNLDMEEIRKRGDSTESDEFLIKAALKAQTSQMKANVNWLVGGIILLVLVGGLIWFFTKGPAMGAPIALPTPTPAG